MKAILILTAVTLANAATTVNFQGFPAPNTGFNLKNESIFTNYDNFKSSGQAFQLWDANTVREAPKNDTIKLKWLSAATFSASPLPPAVNSRVVSFKIRGDGSISAAASLYASSYSAQDNVMEQVFTETYDDSTVRGWDDGLNVSSSIGWEGDDQGDTSAKAVTSAKASYRIISWITVEQASMLLNVSVADLTPAKFNDVYAAAWERKNPPAPAPSPAPPASGAERRAFSVTVFVVITTTLMILC